MLTTAWPLWLSILAVAWVAPPVFKWAEWSEVTSSTQEKVEAEFSDETEVVVRR